MNNVLNDYGFTESLITGFWTKKNWTVRKFEDGIEIYSNATKALKKNSPISEREVLRYLRLKTNEEFKLQEVLESLRLEKEI